MTRFRLFAAALLALLALSACHTVEGFGHSGSGGAAVQCGAASDVTDPG